jgi:MioC protein
MNIHIIYGTETGNAEMVALDLVSHFAGRVAIRASNMDQVCQEDLSAGDLLVVISSTYGAGELPHSAKAFYDQVQDGALSVTGCQFAAFGLGDSQYAETFGNAILLLADLFRREGGHQIGETAIHDASGADLPEQRAIEWLEALLQSANLPEIKSVAV